MISKITKEHREQAREKPVYKVVSAENGKLKSLFITGTKKNPEYISWSSGKRVVAIALTYKPDRVISNGELGIWCCETPEDAREQARSNGHGRLCEIYSVLPIGEPSKNTDGFGTPKTVLYPAIIMGEHIETVDKR